MKSQSQKIKKELKEFEQTTPQQLTLFELGDEQNEDYSNTVELYDMMPKYYLGGVKRDIGKNVDSLPVLERDFKHRGQEYKLNIYPAAIIDRTTGKTIHYLPSQREELVEDVLRKLATKKKGVFLDNNAAVKFTLYEVEKELKKMGHGYNINEIKEAIEICSRTVLEITSKGNGDVSVSANIFPFMGMENSESIKGGRNKVVIMFHPLVTKSINEGTYRLVNYDKLMYYKMPLSRWLYKRMSHNFINAGIDNPYRIKMSTIVRDSGMKKYERNSDIIKQINKSMEELKGDGVLVDFVVEKEIRGRGIVEAIFLMYVSKAFVSDIKKANLLSRKIRPIEKGLDLQNLVNELEDPIYCLSEIEKKEYLNYVKTKEDLDNVINSLKAAKECLERNNDYNPHATIKKAIKDKWNPKRKTENNNEATTKAKENKKLPSKKIVNRDLEWGKVMDEIVNKFEKEEYEKWLKDIRLKYSYDDEVVMIVETKFVRDWIRREYLEKLKDIWKKNDKKIKEVRIVSDEEFVI